MSMTIMVLWQLEGQQNINIPSYLTWNATAPLEIKLVIQTGPNKADDVVWVFARDLLLEAIQKNQAGEADVQMRVKDDTLTMRLESPFGIVSLVTEASFIGQFLARTLAHVPQGKEDCGVDYAIAKILEEMG